MKLNFCTLIILLLGLKESQSKPIYNGLRQFEDCDPIREFIIDKRHSSRSINTSEADAKYKLMEIGSIYDIRQVIITSCREIPCRLPINRRVRVTTEFDSYGQPVHQFLRHEVWYILNNVNTRANIAPDRCNGRICPFPTRYGHGFQSDLLIRSNMPRVRGTLFWRSFNTNGVTVICFRLPIVFVLP